MAKAAASNADGVVLDLEDAVVPAAKESARASILEAVQNLSHRKVFVRINAIGTDDYRRDLHALAPALGTLAGLVIPKAETADELTRLDADLNNVAPSTDDVTELPVLAVLESAAGVLAAPAVAAAPRVHRLIFGTLDLAAETGVRPTLGGTEYLHARSHLVLASAAAGLDGPIDGPHPRIDELQELTDSARHARDLGFRGKVVLHPDQIVPVNAAFSPTEPELAHAREVVDTYRQAQTRGLGAVRLPDGTFIDRPVVVRAAALLGLEPEEVLL
ncbi:CoA ester lyase [Rhodococcus aetherivorans]|nr:CoA ester lyase [Rhodococcus aetherivorans]